MFEQYSYIGLLITITGSVWSLAWWLSNQFTKIRGSMYTGIKELEKTILEKLEYHERHDDGRFSQIQEALTDIRIRNAASDALLVIREKKKEI